MTIAWLLLRTLTDQPLEQPTAWQPDRARHQREEPQRVSGESKRCRSLSCLASGHTNKLHRR